MTASVPQRSPRSPEVKEIEKDLWTDETGLETSSSESQGSGMTVCRERPRWKAGGSVITDASKDCT